MINGQLLMQYPIVLPTDYDMDVIRTRVRTRGGALDDRKGLICKAYCIREAGVDGSPINQYAPFYLWADSLAAADFLWGGQGFDGIVRDFGRPRVHTWTPVSLAVGGRERSDVSHAVFRTAQIDRDADLVAVAQALTARVSAKADDPDVHLAFGGIDPTDWQTVEFTTLARIEDATTVADLTIYQVLYINQPEQP